MNITLYILICFRNHPLPSIHISHFENAHAKHLHNLLQNIYMYVKRTPLYVMHAYTYDSLHTYSQNVPPRIISIYIILLNVDTWISS